MKRVLKVACALLALTLIATVFTACTPKSADLEKKYQDAGYIAFTVKASTYGFDDSKVDYTFAASNLTNTIVVVCFKEGADAKEYFTEVKDTGNYDKVVKKGNAVCFGSEAALKLL